MSSSLSACQRVIFGSMVSALRRAQEPGRGANGPIIACFSLLGPAGLPAKLVLLAIGPCKPRVSNAAPLTCDGQRGRGGLQRELDGLGRGQARPARSFDLLDQRHQGRLVDGLLQPRILQQLRRGGTLTWSSAPAATAVW